MFIPHIRIPFFTKRNATIAARKPLEIEQVSRLIFTPLDEAINEAKRRRTDTALRERVTTYLGGEVPPYFDTKEPTLYLQRFIATPNFELLHATEIAKKRKLQLIVGEDHKSRFNAHNDLKRPLGKLPVLKGLSHTKNEIVEYFTVIDFNAASGKELAAIPTKFGDSLIDLHHTLLKELDLPQMTVIDETAWVDANNRDNIYAQYKKVWALLCVHGIMLEWYLPADYSFFTEVLYPSFKEVESELGVTPLVSELIAPDKVGERNWFSYPSYFYQMLKRKEIN